MSARETEETSKRSSSNQSITINSCFCFVLYFVFNAKNNLLKFSIPSKIQDSETIFLLPVIELISGPDFQNG